MSGLSSSSTRERSRSPIRCPHLILAAQLNSTELAIAYAAGLWRRQQWTIPFTDAQCWVNSVKAAMFIEQNNLIRGCRRRELQPQKMTFQYLRNLIANGVPAESESEEGTVSDTESFHRD